MSERTAGSEVTSDRASAPLERSPLMSDESRADDLLRLRKVNGQVDGIALTVEQDRCCADVLRQLAAAPSVLDAVSREVAREHLEQCVADAVDHGDALVHDGSRRIACRSH